jgi:hypothetical protein
MLVHCPQCGATIPTADVNVTTDVAACRRCDAVFKLSELATAAPAVPLDNPPPGAWYEALPTGFRAGATTRSPIAFFLVPFMLVWSGGSLGGIYGKQIANGQFNPFESLFGIPFLLGSILFWTFALMAIAGKCELRVDGDDAELFVGIGALGWRRRFKWSAIRAVTEAATTTRYPGNQGTALALEGATRIKFASNVAEARRYFLLNALRHHLTRAPHADGTPYRQ